MLLIAQELFSKIVSKFPRSCHDVFLQVWAIRFFLKKKFIHQEIAGNYVWLRPLCHHFKTKVPGALFLTDVMIYLDVLIGGNLLCKPGVDKVAQAADEAKRLKRLMGALRYLWRNSFLEGRKSIFLIFFLLKQVQMSTREMLLPFAFLLPIFIYLYMWSKFSLSL